MKTRSGFVSNSSSSSFIVGFASKPTTVAEVQALLFPDGETEWPSTYYDPKYSKGPATYTTKKIAQVVLGGLLDEEPLTREDIVTEFQRGTLDGVTPDFPSWDLRGKAFTQAWKHFEDRCDAAAEKHFEETLAPLMDKLQFFKLTYSDNDGEFFTTMEHGEIFDKVTHVRVWHH